MKTYRFKQCCEYCNQIEDIFPRYKAPDIVITITHVHTYKGNGLGGISTRMYISLFQSLISVHTNAIFG